MVQKKIKILFTIPNFDTAGSGKVVYDLVKNLDRDTFEPEICCFHSRGVFMSEIEKLQVKVHLFPFAIKYRPYWSFPIRLMKISRFFRRHRFDVIHSWHWSSDFSEPLAAKLSGIPWVFTKKSMGWGNKAWKWRSALSTKIITINSDMNRFYPGKESKKVLPIPLGVDIHHYSPNNRNAKDIRHKLFLEEDDFVVISVVNLIPVKGIENLIRAVIELNDPKMKLLLIGNKEGEYAQGLLHLAKETPTIQFLGKKLDVRPYHAIADVFVIPTLEPGEGLPVAPLEAMASGNIVVGSKVSGIKDILDEFQTCLFKPNDTESLKKVLLSVKAMGDEERFKLAVAMRKQVEEKFSLDSFIKQHEELYKNLVL